MKRNTANRFLAAILIFLSIESIVGCAALPPAATPAATVAATFTPVATSTATLPPTPRPSPTATQAHVPTSSIQDPSAISLSNECRRVVDGLRNLVDGLGVPEHLTSENPVRQATDFDPNSYFQVLTHLKMAAGYKLDFLYFSDELGGMPLVYARKSNSAPFSSYNDFLKSFGEEVSNERSYGTLRHNYDYLEKIQIDRTPESYFEYTTLALLGDQFYLVWHANYNDTRILCDISDVAIIRGELEGLNTQFPQTVEDQIDEIEFEPAVIIQEETVTVRFVSFTKWGGFFENVYVMDINNPMKLLDVKFNPLIQYDCGFLF